MRVLLIAAAFAGFTTGAAFAQASFDAVDADANGAITMEEARAAGFTWTDEQFASADKDADGALNAEEFAAATQ